MNKHCGAESVSQELDLFNLKYQRLCESLRSRIEDVGDKNKDDPEIQVGHFAYSTSSTSYILTLQIKEEHKFYRVLICADKIDCMARALSSNPDQRRKFTHSSDF